MVTINTNTSASKKLSIYDADRKWPYAAVNLAMPHLQEIMFVYFMIF